MTLFRFILAAAILSILPLKSEAADVTLAWDSNLEEDIAGYHVAYGLAPGSYSSIIDVGNTDTFVFANALSGQQYCFAVTAYAGDLVSPLSSEVCSSGNQAPTLSQPFNQRTTVGQPASLQLGGNDPEGAPITYSATGLPPGLTINSSTGLISGIATAAGNYLPIATVSDGNSSTSRSFSWAVVAGNSAPILSNPGTLQTDAGQSVSLQLIASDPDGQPLTFSSTGLPPGLSVGVNTGVITGQPTTPGSYSVTIAVSDGSLSATQTFVWTIRSANQAPTLVNPGPRTSTVGQSKCCGNAGAGRLNWRWLTCAFQPA